MANKISWDLSSSIMGRRHHFWLTLTGTCTGAKRSSWPRAATSDGMRIIADARHHDDCKRHFGTGLHHQVEWRKKSGLVTKFSDSADSVEQPDKRTRNQYRRVREKKTTQPLLSSRTSFCYTCTAHLAGLQERTEESFARAHFSSAQRLANEVAV